MMDYQSTRSSLTATAAAAICSGIAHDGGLYIPTRFPTVTIESLLAAGDKSYTALAETILQPFFEDWPNGTLRACLDKAYGGGNFDTSELTPVKKLREGLFVLELWHGPTSAFKDMALQFLPSLMAMAKKLTGDERTTVILTATSGDTGKAALEGFADQPGTKIFVFYPSEGVSDIQQRQMVTQAGDNVDVAGIEGNFDDAQSAVKQVFTDAAFSQKLAERNMAFSSANSINFGRLAPQIVYYFKSYLDLVKAGEIQAGQKVNFAVPTGNFGNILAGYYASRMGLPIAKLICASNANHVLTDFFTTACYDKNRDFVMTDSPSMDILISSNLERLLAHLCGAEQTGALMKQLAEKGSYTLPDSIRAQLDALFAGGYMDDTQTRAVIRRTFEKDGYLVDPHTAVALGVAEQYLTETRDKTKTVVLSTASAYKFAPAVLAALGIDDSGDQQALMNRLSAATKTPIPQPLDRLWSKPVRFTTKLGRDGIKDYLADSLKL